MKTNLIIAVIAIAFILLFGALVALILPRFINKQPSSITKAEIVKFTQPLHSEAGSRATEEYHLWLKIEMPRPAFDRIFGNVKDTSSTDAPIKKDEMRTERLATEAPLQDMLVIKGYINEGVTTDTAAPLRINRVITLSKENLRPLDDQQSLAAPRIVPLSQFQPLTDIYSADEGGKVWLYIHLESGIKPRATPSQLSLTITYLKDNQAVLSLTPPIFSY